MSPRMPFKKPWNWDPSRSKPYHRWDSTISNTLVDATTRCPSSIFFTEPQRQHKTESLAHKSSLLSFYQRSFIWANFYYLYVYECEPVHGGGGGGGHDHFQKLALSFPAHPSQLLCLFLASPRLLSPSQLWSIHSGGFLCISASCQTHLWALHSLNLPTNWATRRRNFFPPPASHAPSRSYLGEKAGTHSIEHSLDAPRGNSAVWKLCNVNNWCTWEVVIKLVNYAGKITCNYVTAGYV